MNLKWKTQGPPKNTGYGQKLFIADDQDIKITVSSWEFVKVKGDGPAFKCFVVEEDGLVVDKIWYVWDYELTEALKVLLRGKNPDLTKVKLIVRRHEEDLEETFEVKSGEVKQ